MLEYGIGDGYSALDAQANRDKLDGYAVVSGLGVSVDSGLTLSVDPGEATVGETGGSVDTVSLGSSTTVTLNAADSTHPRKDTIYIDTAGAVQVETGTANAAGPAGNERFATFEPAPPLPSSDGTVLAEVWVPAGASSVVSADVRDRRVPADVVGDRGVFDSLEAGEEGSKGSLTVNGQTSDHHWKLVDEVQLGDGNQTVEFTFKSKVMLVVDVRFESADEQSLGLQIANQTGSVYNYTTETGSTLTETTGDTSIPLIIADDPREVGGWGIWHLSRPRDRSSIFGGGAVTRGYPAPTLRNGGMDSSYAPSPITFVENEVQGGTVKVFSR